MPFDSHQFIVICYQKKILQMPELSDAVVTNSGPEMSSILENLQKHKLNTQARQNLINASTSSIKETSSSSQQVSDLLFVEFSLKKKYLTKPLHF